MNEKELTSSFKALSWETRRKIIYLLKSKCLCAGDIAKHFELTGATISHHLKVLAEGNLITSKKVGLEIYYSLNIEKYNVICMDLWHTNQELFIQHVLARIFRAFFIA